MDEFYIPSEDGAEVPVKHNFTELFDIPVFAGTYSRSERFASGIPKHNKDGTPRLKEVPEEEDVISHLVENKFKLTPNSEPADFADVFLPFICREGMG